MKFLMTLYEIQDYGGIINHVENLAYGLKQQGHEVDFTILVPRTSVQDKVTAVDEKEGWRTLGTGFPFHQQKGWKNVPRTPIVGHENILNWQRKTERYDAILWHIPVPTINKGTAGIFSWPDLYHRDRANYAIIHDGNLPKLYPHISVVQEAFKALICVHESAFESTKLVGLPRILIPNPFKFHSDLGAWVTRNGFVAVQVFKAWKRVDSLIRAIPHMKNKENKIIGGGGIEQRYMVSPDKCKPQYFDENGNRIWNQALLHGMEYVGFIPNDQVLNLLFNARVHIDPSWSKKYSQYGAHFNRTTIEAMMCGCIPMATDLGMKNSEFFRPGKNFVEIPHNATPKEFAELVDETLASPDFGMVYENYKHLNMTFSCEEIAARYAWLVKNPLPKPDYETDPALIAAGLENMKHFRGEK